MPPAAGADARGGVPLLALAPVGPAPAARRRRARRRTTRTLRARRCCSGARRRGIRRASARRRHEAAARRRRARAWSGCRKALPGSSCASRFGFAALFAIVRCSSFLLLEPDSGRRRDPAADAAADGRRCFMIATPARRRRQSADPGRDRRCCSRAGRHAPGRAAQARRSPTPPRAFVLLARQAIIGGGAASRPSLEVAAATPRPRPHGSRGPLSPIPRLQYRRCVLRLAVRRRRCRSRSGMRRRWSSLGRARAGPSRSSSAPSRCWRNKGAFAVYWPRLARRCWLVLLAVVSLGVAPARLPQRSTLVATPLTLLLFSTVFYASLWFYRRRLLRDPARRRSRRATPGDAPIHSRKRSMNKSPSSPAPAAASAAPSALALLKRRLARRARRPPRRRARGDARGSRWRRRRARARSVPTDADRPGRGARRCSHDARARLRPARRAVQQRRHRRAADAARGADGRAVEGASSTST